MHENILLELALILFAAKIAGELFERFLKQPAVLAEIVVGIVLGTSSLRWIDGQHDALKQMAEVGAVLLLFVVGLECDLEELLKVGKQALLVGFAGVLLPFGLGYLVAAALGEPTLHAIFIGAVLTATSVGITARVFSDMGILNSRDAQIVLGAAIVDDVIALIILATVSGLGSENSISAIQIAKISGIALLFLVGAVVIGQRAAPWLLRVAQSMKSHDALALVAIALCLGLSALAGVAGLAPIIGAFAAGLVLAKTEQKSNFEEKVKGIAGFFVPVFFVLMGASMQLDAIKGPVIVMGLALTAVAIFGKLAAGYVLPGKTFNRNLVGIGMVPRGEVGLIFASVGLARDIITPGIYAAIIFVVVGTTFVTPPLLKWAARGQQPVAT